MISLARLVVAKRDQDVAPTPSARPRRSPLPLSNAANVFSVSAHLPLSAANNQILWGPAAYIGSGLTDSCFLTLGRGFQNVGSSGDPSSAVLFLGICRMPCGNTLLQDPEFSDRQDQ